MTYPEGRQPIEAQDMAKLHPSTWQQEVEQLQEKVTELAMLVLAAEGQAEEAYQAQLSAEAAASWGDIRANQAIDEAKALRAENERLRDLVRNIRRDADEWCISRMTGNPELENQKGEKMWRTIRNASSALAPIAASAALQKQEGME